MAGKIDVHTHAVPPFFRDHLEELQSKGVPVVDWSLDSTKRMNDKLGVSTSILSLSVPGAEIRTDRDDARKVAREFNQWAAKLRDDDPSHFGFFAAIPSMVDVEGCMNEIARSFDDLRADGVCVFTSYDGKYLGDPAFDAIWEELNRRKSVVFVHPIQPKEYRAVSPMLEPPAFDFPHETGRTAAHMIMTGTKRRYSDAKIILSHAGGTLPLLAERLAQLDTALFRNTLEERSPNTAEQIVSDAKSFYFDSALSGTHNVLDLLLNWAPGHVLFGSDFPYCTIEAEYNTSKLEIYAMGGDFRESINRGAALELFPRLR